MLRWSSCCRSQPIRPKERAAAASAQWRYLPNRLTSIRSFGPRRPRDRRSHKCAAIRRPLNLKPCPMKQERIHPHRARHERLTPFPNNSAAPLVFECGRKNMGALLSSKGWGSAHGHPQTGVQQPACRLSFWRRKAPNERRSALLRPEVLGKMILGGLKSRGCS